MFRFRLETLLRLRRDERDRCRKDLAEAFQAERVVEGRLTDTNAEIEDVLDLTRRCKEGGPVNVDMLSEAKRYQLVLLSRKKILETQLVQVGQETGRRRSTLAEADRQVRVLEKLKENQQEQYDVEEFRRECNTFDEIASIGYTRKGDDT